MLAAFVTPVLAGILLGCCFLPPPAYWLAWIALVPAAAAITRRGHVVANYLGMYCAGLAFNLITTDWVRTLQNGAWLSGRSAPDWLFQAQLIALFWPLTLLLGRALVANWPMSVGLGVVWIIHELLVRSLWALIDQTGWQVYFLGYAVVDHRYVPQIADLGGVSGLGFVVACVNGAIWDVFAGHWRPGQTLCIRRRTMFGAGFAVCLVVFSYAYGAWRIGRTQLADGPTIWLMPEDSLRQRPARLPWGPGQLDTPDVLLWSELAYHGPPVEPSQVGRNGSAPSVEPSVGSATAHADPPSNRSETALCELCRQFDIPMVVGYTRTDGPAAQRKTYNSAAFLDPNQGIQGSYDKIGLVPWAEFTPLHGLTSRRASHFTHGAQCRVFELAGAATQKTHRFAVAICYDVAFPQIFRQAMQSADGAPEFFLVCSSERSDRTGRMSRHLLNLARLRAIECRRTLVRNVNLGRSGRIDSTGRLCDETLPLLVQSATPLGQIPIDSRSTLYLLWGDWIPTVVVCVALASVGWRLSRRRRSNSVMPARQGATEDPSERNCFAHARLLDEIMV